MEKRIAFMSTGCQSGFGRPREIIASIPELTEVDKTENPDYIMANFCAISTENIDAFTGMKKEILRLKQENPNLKVLAGGCVEGLSVKKDLSFADALYHHQGEAAAFLQFLGYDTIEKLRPAILYDAAYIVIAQGCNRRCTFCKVHYLDHMQLTSRPIAEIMALVYAALEQGVHNVHLYAENSTEYGTDIGTNICNLLQMLFAIKDIRYIDVSGLCAEEINPKLLSLLQNPKVRQIQIETQSLNNSVRRAMGLNKTADEILAIHDALRGKFITSVFMSGFNHSNIKEFDKEMKLIERHHLYYLTLTPYDDTEGTPSHLSYQKPSQDELTHYQMAFLGTIIDERQLIFDELKAKEYIEASIIIVSDDTYTLIPANYSIRIIAKNRDNRYHVGNIVRVKVRRVHRTISLDKQEQFFNKQHQVFNELGHDLNLTDDSKAAEFLQALQLMGDLDQIMQVWGTIITE